MNESMGQKFGEIGDVVRCLLERNRLGVLATQHSGQPHASLIAFTLVEGLRSIVFATYRDTRKCKNILEDRRVAILVEDREGSLDRPDCRLVLTAVGDATKATEAYREAHIMTHLARHPYLDGFLNSRDCEFMHVAVHAYQVVRDIDDARWYEIGELAAQ